jgi:TolB-like protein/Tfp pilus assembly protein PilF
MDPKKFFSELKRREVYGVAISYGITAWVLAQIAGLVTNSFEAPSWVMKVIIIALIIGFPIAVILAWVYDMTPHGIIKTKPKESENNQTQKSKKSIIWSLFLSAIIIISFVAIGSWWALNIYKSNDTKATKALAILPLRDFTNDDSRDYLADGLHSNLITQISKISSLRTIPPRSTMKYKNSEKSISVIAKELGVDVIMETDIMKFGDYVQLNFKLIQAFPKERTIWGHLFEKPMSDIYELYNEVSQQIAKELGLILTEQEKILLSTARKVNPEAYQAYLKGVFHWMKLTESDLEQSLKYFQLAMQIDPEYGAAYAGIASVGAAKMQNGIVRGIEAIPKLDSLMSKALELDDTLMEVHYTIAVWSTWGKWDWKRAEEAYNKAIALNPNHAATRAYYSHFLYIIGEPEKALLQIEKALELDPVNPLFKALYGMCLNYSRKFDEAIDLLNNTLKTSPNDPVALSTLRSAYHNNKEFDKAYQIFIRSYEVVNDEEAVLALKKGYANGGYSNALNSLAELLIDRSSTQYVTPWRIGTLYTRSGNNNLAINYLYAAYNDHDSNMPYINIDPIFDDLKNYPEFRNLITKMNFPNSD